MLKHIKTIFSCYRLNISFEIDLVTNSFCDAQKFYNVSPTIMMLICFRTDLHAAINREFATCGTKAGSDT